VAIALLVVTLALGAAVIALAREALESRRGADRLERRVASLERSRAAPQVIEPLPDGPPVPPSALVN